MTTKTPREIVAEIVDSCWVDNYDHNVDDGCSGYACNLLVDRFTAALDAERKKTQMLKGALVFYASGEHVDADDYDTETMDQGDYDQHSYLHGKHAREALKSLEESEG